MLYSSLEARLSALLFVLSSFLYLLTSWLFWPIIIQVPTSFTGGPPKLSIFLFCRTVFSTPWLDLDLQSGHSLLSAKLLLTFFNWLTAQTLLLCYIYYSKKMDILHNSHDWISHRVMSLYIFLLIHTHTHTHTQINHTDTHTHTHTDKHTYTHTHTHTGEFWSHSRGTCSSGGRCVHSVWCDFCSRERGILSHVSHFLGATHRNGMKVIPN